MPAAPHAADAPSTDAELRLHLVRHGRTVYNVERLMQGWSDSPLTPDGEEGVVATARWLAPVPFVAAYTSPLGRTVRTTELLLAEHPTLRPVALDGLREFGFGDYEATSEAELFATVDPFTMFGSIVGGTFEGLAGGETGPAFRTRVDDAFGEIVARHPDGGDVLVVSHGVTLAAYLAVASGLDLAGVDPLRHGPLENASVSLVAIDAARRTRVLDVNAGPWTGRAPGVAGAPGA